MELESGQNLNILLVKVINVNFVHNIFVVTRACARPLDVVFSCARPLDVVCVCYNIFMIHTWYHLRWTSFNISYWFFTLPR